MGAYATSALALFVLAEIPMAQAPSQPSSGQPTAQLPRGQMPVRGRATTKDDEMPLFNFDEYFLGTWKFTWDVPESPLGPGGRIEGTEVFKPVPADPSTPAGRFYQSDLKASGPDGPIDVRSTIIYHKENKVVVRYERDSRGFELVDYVPVPEVYVGCGFATWSIGGRAAQAA